jgi:hypothetical protein
MSDEAQQKKPTAVQLQMQLDDDVAQGQYINLVTIYHTDTEFILDFIYVQPQQPRAKVRSRILLAPRHAKRLLMALNENLRVFEKKFGEISLPKAPGGEGTLH